MPLMTPAQALKTHGSELTPREQTEILEFQTVFYLALGVPKHQLSSTQPNFGYDDPEGNYLVVIGDHLAFRYQVLAKLGQGSFGQVVRAYDHKRQEEVAVKILAKERELDTTELKILDLIRTNDPDDSSCLVRMKNSFLFRQHICLTVELLSISLWDYLQSQQFARTSPTLVRRFAGQILTALSFTVRLGVVHCDVKPENILLKQQDKSLIKLIDFGCATFLGKKSATYIQSRFYRAPEVVLRLPHTSAIDMWSFGCVLAEMCTGKALFPAEDEVQLLLRQLELLGRLPRRLITRSPVKDKYFLPDYSVKLIADHAGKLHEPGSSSLAERIGVDDQQLLNLLVRCLDLDPTTRLTADEALRHPWFRA
jgi:dual specificity tyrosine-phosphorylation-regulated kinase 2/3/4